MAVSSIQKFDLPLDRAQGQDRVKKALEDFSSMLDVVRSANAAPFDSLAEGRLGRVPTEVAPRLLRAPAADHAGPLKARRLVRTSCSLRCTPQRGGLM